MGIAATLSQGSHLSADEYFGERWYGQNYPAALVLQNWNEAIWRETVLLYTAQLPPKLLNQIIRKACEQGSEAAELAAVCLQEYPRPEKIDHDLGDLLDSLKAVAQDSKYQTLEMLLQGQQWREADNETYRLMITTVGKEEGQLLSPKDLLNFPCADLKTIDVLWVKYSSGKFGFSVQKQIYDVACGAKLDGKYPGKIFDTFADRVGWRKNGQYVTSYKDLKANLKFSPSGEFPGVVGDGLDWMGWRNLFSRIETCEL